MIDMPPQIKGKLIPHTEVWKLREPQMSSSVPWPWHSFCCLRLWIRGHHLCENHLEFQGAIVHTPGISGSYCSHMEFQGAIVHTPGISGSYFFRELLFTHLEFQGAIVHTHGISGSYCSHTWNFRELLFTHLEFQGAIVHTPGISGSYCWFSTRRLSYKTWPCVELFCSYNSAMLHASEIWQLTKPNLMCLQRNDRTVIRRMCNIKPEELATVRSWLSLRNLTSFWEREKASMVLTCGPL